MIVLASGIAWKVQQMRGLWGATATPNTSWTSRVAAVRRWANRLRALPPFGSPGLPVALGPLTPRTVAAHGHTAVLRSGWRTTVSGALALALSIAMLGALPAPPAHAQTTSTLTLQVISARTEPRALGGTGVVKGDQVDTFEYIINIDTTGTTEQRSPEPGTGCSSEDPGYPGSSEEQPVPGSGLRCSVVPVVSMLMMYSKVSTWSPLTTPVPPRARGSVRALITWSVSVLVVWAWAGGAGRAPSMAIDRASARAHDCLR